MATVKEVYSGDDLMIFDGETNKSWAWAQSHSLSVNIDVLERLTKDNPKNPIKEVSKITYEITTENLFCSDFDELFAKMIAGEYITVKFGKKKNEGDKLPSEGDIEAWTLDEDQNFWVGKFLISSLQANAATGEDATYSATFSGCGKIVSVKQEWRVADIPNPITENYSFLRTVEVPVLDENGTTLDKTMNITRTWNEAAWLFTPYDPEDPTSKGEIMVSLPNYNVSFGIQANTGEFSAKTLKFSAYSTGDNIYCTVGGETVTLQSLIPRNFTLTIPDNNTSLENNFNFIVDAHGSGGTMHIFYPRFSETVSN